MTGALAIVPARGGSRGIPRKNLARLAGRTLLDWTLQCAHGAESIERVLVTTDCARIAGAARRAGAEVPFLRPAALARDDTPGIESVLHALDWLARNQDYRPEWVVLLQPTSPLRTSADVDAALESVQRQGASAIVSVAPAASHPCWSRRIDAEGRLQPYLDTPTPPRRQELPAAFALNGAIYASRREALLERRGFEGPDTRAYPMPKDRSVDVDEPFDLEVAELLLRRRETGVRERGAVEDGGDHPLEVRGGEARR